MAVGLTVAAAALLTIYIVVALGDWSNLMAAKQDIRVQISQEPGLQQLSAGSPVYLGGVKIGKIMDAGIEELGEPGDEIVVFFVMQIPKEYQLRRDCALTAVSNVLGGQASLGIKDLGSTGELIEDGQTVRLELEGGIGQAIEAVKRELNTADPCSILSQLKYELNRGNSDSILASLVSTAAHFKELSAKVNAQVTLDEQKESLMSKVHFLLDHLGELAGEMNSQFDTENKQAMLVKLNAALDRLNSSLAEVGELIETNKAPISATIASVAKTAKTVEEDIPQITAQIKGSLAKADSAIDTAKLALENIKALTETLVINRDLVEKIIRNFNEVSVNLKTASREIRRAPWRLLYKPKKGELHIQGLIDSAGDFATAAELLDNASLRLRATVDTAAAEGIDDEQVPAMISELEGSFERFKEAEAKFWDELDR